MTFADMLSSMRTGDVILFEAGYLICLIPPSTSDIAFGRSLSGGCYHSGRIASVGVVYHGASVLPAQTNSGKRCAYSNCRVVDLVSSLDGWPLPG